MSTVVMADDKPGTGKPKGKDVKPSFTTFRIYEADGEDLSDLAGLEGKTAADVYHEHCGPVIRKLLRQRMQERLKKLDG